MKIWKSYLALLSVVVITGWSVFPCAHSSEVVSFESGSDKAIQKAKFYAPATTTSVPLMVLLHTWSGNYKQKKYSGTQKWCKDNGWAYIHPDFRGPNYTPKATGSDFAVADIISAVEYAKKKCND